MVWHRTGTKPLREPKLAKIYTMCPHKRMKYLVHERVFSILHTFRAIQNQIHMNKIFLGLCGYLISNWNTNNIFFIVNWYLADLYYSSHDTLSLYQIYIHKEYPRNYACFFTLFCFCCGSIMMNFIHNLHDYFPGSAFIKRDQLNPRIKDQLRKALLSTIWPLQLPNFVSCGRDKPSHMTQNLVTVGAKLLTGEWFLLDPWSMDQADPVW